VKWFRVRIKHTAPTGVSGQNGLVVKFSQAPIHASEIFTVMPEELEHATIHMPPKEAKHPIVKEKSLNQESVKEVHWLKLQNSNKLIIWNLVTDMAINGQSVLVTADLVNKLVGWFINALTFQVPGSVKINGTWL
jgi:hypothetical protein